MSDEKQARIGMSRGRWVFLAAGAALLVAFVVVGVRLLGPYESKLPTPLPIYKDSCVFDGSAIAFEDVNGNGQQDTGEAGLSGVHIRIRESDDVYIVPDGNGFYHTDANGYLVTDGNGMADLDFRTGTCEVGTKLQVVFEPPAGWVATTPVSFDYAFNKTSGCCDAWASAAIVVGFRKRP